MNWATSLGKIEYYLIGAFMLSYILYLIRLIRITLSNVQADVPNILKKIILRSAYFTLLMVSILGPSFGNLNKEARSIGKDLILVVDVSLSMACADVFPTRLDWCRKELDYLISHLKFNDRIGLIAYAGEAVVQCPLTYDADAIRLYLHSLKPGMLPGGSDLSGALELAVKKLDSAKTQTETSQAILLASDGENFSTSPAQVTAALIRNKIAFVTLGVGTLDGGNINLRRGLKLDYQGNPVRTKLQRNYLLQLANSANGRYFEPLPNAAHVQGLLEHLNSMAVSVKEIENIATTTNKYYYFLFAALLLMAADVLTTVNIVRI